jgi:hypothetical protein
MTRIQFAAEADFLFAATSRLLVSKIMKNLTIPGLQGEV